MHRCTRRGFVVREAISVDTEIDICLLNGRNSSGSRLNHDWVAQMGRKLRGLSKLGRELTENEVSAALVDQAKRCGIPKQTGSTVANNNFPVLG